jgi:hypothetical protein
MSLIALLTFALLATAFPSSRGISADEIMEQVRARDVIRAKQLAEYGVTRDYRIENTRWNKKALVTVRVQFDQVRGKTFEILSQSGSEMIRNRVVKKLLETETEASVHKSRPSSVIDSSNYVFKLVGEGVLRDRPAYLVYATPRRKDTLLFEGTVYVDKEDLAIARIEGRAARNPSFWIKRIDFTREYRKLGELWLPAGDTSITQVKVFGPTKTDISVGEYRIGLNTESQ